MHASHKNNAPRTANWLLLMAVAAYAGAMVLANLSISTFGPKMAPINGFILIGLDLALRDWLHVRLKTWQMLALIAVTGCITLALDPAAAHIALASATAFTAAAFADWLTFARLHRQRWAVRSNLSNVAGAAVDSLVFPAMAFGGLQADIVITMFLAKVGGGLVWSMLLARGSAGHTGGNGAAAAPQA